MCNKQKHIDDDVLEQIINNLINTFPIDRTVFLSNCVTSESLQHFARLRNGQIEIFDEFEIFMSDVVIGMGDFPFKASYDYIGGYTDDPFVCDEDNQEIDDPKSVIPEEDIVELETIKEPQVSSLTMESKRAEEELVPVSEFGKFSMRAEVVKEELVPASESVTKQKQQFYDICKPLPVNVATPSVKMGKFYYHKKRRKKKS